jgi:flagellin
VSNTERGFIDKEVQQLKQEVNRIANSTEFNGHKLLSGEGEMMEIQVGLNNNPELDRFKYDTAHTNVTLDKLGLSGINVADKSSSQENLSKVDEAIKVLSGNRAELGALQNRLQSGVNSMTIYHENMSAARSRIYDVDMASETAELTKQNILSQAGVSVLSQANQNNMLALKLLA